MSKPQILIVEDEGVIALDIEEALTSLNYGVAGIAESAEDAFSVLERTTPDLVLMDIHLKGGMDGIEAAIRAKERFNIPVVFLTAYADKVTLDRAKVIEPYGYVLKPFRQTELRTVIELALHKHEAEKRRLAEPGPAKSEPAPVLIPNFKALVDLQPPPAAMQVTMKHMMQSMPLFSDLGEELVEAILPVCLIQNYKSHEIVIREGSVRRSGFSVIDGRVAVYKTSAGGKELTVELLGAWDLFGLLTVMEHAPFPFSARTQGETRILWVPKEVIIFIVDNYSEVRQELFGRVLERLRKAYDLSRALAHDRVEVRVASALLAVGETFAERVENIPGAVEFELTRQELGELVGTTPETVSRILNKMQDEGVVDLSHSGKVRLLRPEELTGMSYGSSNG